MYLPKEIDRVSIDTSNNFGPYPPLGFIPIYEAELGNGDYYGLYWPLGKENEEPIICDMIHDEWRIEPSFSSLSKFIQWLNINDWERGDEEIEDPANAPFLYQKGKELLSSSDVENAINYLKQACDKIPEVSEYWFTLFSQLRRVEKIEEASQAILNSFHSNWIFGVPTESVLRNLKNKEISELLSDDPIIKRINEITFNFGGAKENPVYDIFQECIREYFEQGDFPKGLLLSQNYAFMMLSETTSFQERYGFNLEKWQREFSELCSKYLGESRTITSQKIEVEKGNDNSESISSDIETKLGKENQSSELPMRKKPWWKFW